MKSILLSQVFLLCLLGYSEYVEASLHLPLQKIGNQVQSSYLRRRGVLGANLTNEISGYLAEISFGTPPQKFLLEIDTGSANLYILDFDSHKSTTFKALPDMGDFSAQYGTSGTDFANGTYFSDTVTFGNATIANQIAGIVDTMSSGLPLGLVGIGYENDESIASNNEGSSYPNIIASLQEQGMITKQAYSISFGSINGASESSILFDTIDSTKFTGPLTYLPTQLDPVTSKHKFLTVALSSISLSGSGLGNSSQNSQTLPLPNNLPINATLDTGTSLLQLPPSVAQPVLTLVNATYVPNPFPHWSVPCTLPPSIAKTTLSFQFGSPSTATPPPIPSASTSSINSTASNNGTPAAEGPNVIIPLSNLVLPSTALVSSVPSADQTCTFGITNGTFGDSYGWIFGDPFLRAVYMVVDLEDNVIGLAQSKE